MRTDDLEKYKEVKELFDLGRATGFDRIFRLVGPGTMAKDLGVNYNTFTNKVANPGKFTVQDMCEMSELAGVGDMEFIRFIHELYRQSNPRPNSI